jgi:sulfite exporter TauE/SafE
LTCLAVQGGLLATLVAERSEELQEKVKQTGAAMAIILFLAAKLFIHALLGFGLGFLGSRLQLSLDLRITLAILAGLFMIGTAFRILDIHPIFRYLSVQPPKFLFKIVRNNSKGKSYFAPVTLGLMTVFIPCGTTQAMEVLAVASGNPISGSLIMSAFVLGTSPVFFILGYLATKLGESMHRYFLRFAAILVIILGLISINTGLTLAGHPLKLSLIEVEGPGGSQIQTGAVSGQSGNVTTSGGVQEVSIQVYPTSYQPGLVYVSHTMPIKVQMKTGPGFYCTNTVVFSNLGKQFDLNQNAVSNIDLGTQPPGQINYICGSGMYSGTIIVQ